MRRVLHAMGWSPTVVWNQNQPTICRLFNLPQWQQTSSPIMSQQRHAAARQLYRGCPCVSLNCCWAFEITDVLLIGCLHEGKEQVLLLAEQVATCQKKKLEHSQNSIYWLFFFFIKDATRLISDENLVWQWYEYFTDVRDNEGPHCLHETIKTITWTL